MCHRADRLTRFRFALIVVLASLLNCRIVADIVAATERSSSETSLGQASWLSGCLAAFLGDIAAGPFAFRFIKRFLQLVFSSSSSLRMHIILKSFKLGKYSF